MTSATLFPAEVDVLDLLPENGGDGSIGMVVIGAQADERAGIAVSGAQDLNNDGVADIAVGADDYDFPGRTNAGAMFVVYGGPALGAQFDLSRLEPEQAPDGSLGFMIIGATGQVRLGETVADIGDISGDGIGDLLFGDPEFGSVGVSYLLNGFDGVQPFPFGPVVDADEFNFFDIGSNYVGSVPGDSPVAGDEEKSGSALANVGDVNGDGFDDLGIGGPGAALPSVPRPQATGRAYVVFGPTDELLNGNDLLEITPGGGNDGSRGFVVDGFLQRSTVGSSITGAGDINNDGVDDVAVGAAGLGQVFVIYGSRVFNPARYDVRQFAEGANDGTFGFLIQSLAQPAGLGGPILGGTDFNQDGLSDLVITASRGRNEAPEIFVLYGRDSDFPPAVDLSDLRTGDGSQGTHIIATIDDVLALSDLAAGDVNNDGLVDLVIGAGSDTSVDGRAYVLFGKAGGFAPTVHLADLFAANGGDGTAGFVVVSGASIQERVGASVSSGGDVNGDGLQDLIVGSPTAGENGAAYVVYGRQAPDLDGDGIDNGADNCTLVANADQRDSNGDGFGNVCDADLDDNCIVDPQDWFIMRDVIGTDDADADLNGDGIVNGVDALTLLSNRFSPPGPSGVTNACDAN
ncbi:MAG: integrin alpha [Pseudomonadota bacterium]